MIKKELLFLIALLLNVFSSTNAQSKLYEIDASHIAKKDITSINMEATNPKGVRLSVNNQYFEKTGSPGFR